MKMKNAVRMIVLGMLLSLLGCGSGPAAEQPPQGDPNAGKISFMIFGDPAEKAAYEALVAAFNKRHPAITVELSYIPGQSDYRARLGSDFAAGTPANIVLLNYRRYAAFATQNLLEPLGPYLADSTLIREQDFYPAAIEPFKWQGTLMCLPQNLSSLVVYYNKTLFDQAGVAYPADDWTWDDFLTTAQALTRDTDQDGVADQHGLGVEALLFRMAPFIWQNGGELVDDPRQPTRLTLDTPETREAVQWFVDLQVKHHVVPNKLEEAAEDFETRFLNGRVAMYLNSRRGVPAYRQITSFDWDVAPLPRGKQQAGILHSDAYCMTAATNAKAAAWTFIEYANSPEGQTILAQSGRTVPSLVSVAQSPAFLDPQAKPRNSKIFLEGGPTLRAVPIVERWVEIEDRASLELERAFHGDISVDEALALADQQTRQYFAPRARP